jgi:hypothetical protein
LLPWEFIFENSIPMYDPLQTEQPDHQIEPEPELSFLQRFQQKLTESRYFMISMIFHSIIVAFAATYVVIRATEPPEFVAEGGDGLISATDDLTPPPETPSDAVPTEQVAPTAPNINSPTIDVIQTTSSTSSFKVAPTQVNVKINTNAADLSKATGNIAKGISGGLGNLPGSMRGRVGTGRAKAMEQNKMKTATEMAVLKGLRWLQANQNADGSWGDSNKGAMTGFGLLCVLGHGETPESQEFGLTVNKAVQWILDNGTKHEGRLHMANSFNQPGVYEHGICAYALGEYYTMTQDDRVKELFKQAIGYIVQGQGPGGGWMYSYDKTADDLSVGGWQIQALKAAHLSKLDIYGVDQALDKAIAYIERVKGPKGGYGYRGPEDRYSLTGVGILCQLFWKGERGSLRKGMEWLLDETEKSKPVKYKSEHADLYAWYYHTQACLMFGGSAWTKWNRWFQDEIVTVQNTDGSWPAPGGKGHGPQSGNSKSGQVYRTSLCILMLEVFYRYMPTTQG